ncbi:MAG TPA: hypothetical protein VGC54_02605 [Planctomycetota bacterium]
MPGFLIPFGAALAAGLAVARPLATACARVGFVDRPGGRKGHRAPVGLGGFLYALLLFPALLERSLALALAAQAVFLLGLGEDLLKARGREIPWPLRLTGFAAATAVLPIADPGLFAATGSAAAAAALGLLFLATIHFNWLDHADGLAAAAALGALLGIATASEPAANALGLPCGLLAAFLWLNGLRPGGPLLFLGDAGAQLLGFGVVAIALWPPQGAAAPSLWPALAVSAIPLGDAVRVTLQRIAQRVAPWRPDRERHLGHLAARARAPRPALPIAVGAASFLLVLLAV